MSNIPVHLLYTLLGVFSFICALSIALFKQDKNNSHWILVAIQIIWSTRMLIYAQLFNPEKCHMIWTWPVYIIASMAYAPLFYLFTMELTDLKGITRKDYMVFIPTTAIMAMLLVIYLGANRSTLTWIHENVILGGNILLDNKEISIMGYLCYHMTRTVTFWFEAGVMLWCCWCMYRYEDTINDYFSSNYGKSVSQSRIMATLTAIGVVVVLLREASPDFQQEISMQKVILILITFFFQLSLTILAFGINYSADDIRHMLEKGEQSKQPKSPYTENRQELTISNCWNNLERLMNEQKVFLEPDLNLIDLAQRLGTNRTYLSLAVRQFSGKSFSDYVNYARIVYAQELLLKGETIKNVEYSCGYISSSTFYRQFQKVTGASPVVWLRNTLESQV